MRKLFFIKTRSTLNVKVHCNIIQSGTLAYPLVYDSYASFTQRVQGGTGVPLLRLTVLYIIRHPKSHTEMLLRSLFYLLSNSYRKEDVTRGRSMFPGGIGNMPEEEEKKKLKGVRKTVLVLN